MNKQAGHPQASRSIVRRPLPVEKKDSEQQAATFRTKQASEKKGHVAASIRPEKQGDGVLLAAAPYFPFLSHS